MGGGLVDQGTVLIKCFLQSFLGRAEGPTAGSAGRSDQTLEVQPGRRRRACQVACLHGGVSGGAGAVQHPACTLVRRFRPTASGIATGRSLNYWWSTCEPSTSVGRLPTSTSTTEKARQSAAS